MTDSDEDPSVNDSSSSETKEDNNEAEEEFYECLTDEDYDEEDGDYLHAYGGLYQFEDDEFYDAPVSRQSVPAGFPPPLSSYVDVDTTIHPKISLNGGKDEAWEQVKKEASFVCDKFGVRQDATQKIFEELFGEDSKLFAAWKEVAGSRSLSQFSAFLATFFLECRLKTTYQDLYDDNIIDTASYLTPKEYKAFWTKIDQHKKTDRFHKRAWEHFEDAFNTMAKDILVPTCNEFKMRITCDDDKHHFGFGIKPRNIPLNENAYLKRERHVKDNAMGIVLDALVYTGSGLPLHLHYRRTGESEYDSVVTAFKFLFNYGDGVRTKPNLSGNVEFAADRGYWRPGILYYILSLGADIIGTVMRQSWFPFTFGKKKSDEGEGPEFISTNGAPCLYQKSASHNFGKNANHDFSLTATAFRNGQSSTVAMAINSNPSYSSNRYLDIIIRTAESARHYFSKAPAKSSKRFMYGFTHLIGANPFKEDNDPCHAHALNLYVKPLTEEQGDRGWFIMRSHSCTSSSMDKVIAAKAPFISTQDKVYSDYRRVLNYMLVC